MEALIPLETSIICPANDGEGKTIIAIARRLGFDVRESFQPWGATLDKEPESTFYHLKKNVVIVEIPGFDKENELRHSHTVYIIDHHQYEGIDRRHPRSSLEQFAALVGYALTRQELGIALNDRGHIVALRENGYSEEEIKDIRQVDLSAQGYTADDLKSAKRDYAAGKLLTQDIYLVVTKSAKTSYFADLHDKRGCGSCLLILQVKEDDRITSANFYGTPERIDNLCRKIGGYCGGANAMYWGKTFDPPVHQNDVLSIVCKSAGKNKEVCE